MRPVSFPGQTKVLNKPAGMTDEECKSLPVFCDGGSVISCWRPTWRERLSVLLFGRVWLHLLSGVTQPPAFITGKRTYLEPDDGKDRTP